MDVRITNKNILFFSFLLLTLSVSGIFMISELNNYIAYMAYSLLLSKTIFTFFNNKSFRKEVLTFNNFIIIIALLIGIMIQHMDFIRKLRLILTMLIIINFALFSRGIALTFNDIRAGAHGIFLGIILVFFLGLISGFPLFGMHNEGYLQFAFTGGFLHKNIFGFILLASFSILQIYWKFVKKRTLDFFVILIEAILLILSNARGALLLAFVFFVLINLRFFICLIRLKSNIVIFFIFIIFVSFFYYFFKTFALNSGTFGHRLNGFISWLVLFGNNQRILLFGNAAEVFSGSDYVETVRGMLDGKGTVEMGLLSVLIKNGIVGLIGYCLIFFRAFTNMRRNDLLQFKLPLFALIITMILSVLTEPYLVNSTVCYGTFSFMALSRLSSMATVDRSIYSSRGKVLK